MFYDSSYGIFGTKQGKSTFPEYLIDLSLLDINFIFRKDIYYEIKYYDKKTEKLETMSQGGVYSIKINTRKKYESDVSLRKVMYEGIDKNVQIALEKKVRKNGDVVNALYSE